MVVRVSYYLLGRLICSEVSDTFAVTGYFPHVVSLIMDEITLQTFSDFCVTGTPCNILRLPYLTSEENVLFSYLAEGNIRLEQERVSHVYALEQIERTCSN